ncbi:MAG: hypothetical protein K2Z80_13560 [Xanthobacteraceae bacterium]|nr:hypothetical protein [Xanthobacteraceae bacterium]
MRHILSAAGPLAALLLVLDGPTAAQTTVAKARRDDILDIPRGDPEIATATLNEEFSRSSLACAPATATSSLNQAVRAQM